MRHFSIRKVKSRCAVRTKLEVEFVRVESRSSFISHPTHHPFRKLNINPIDTMVRTVKLSDGTSMPALAWGNMGGNEKALQAGTVALQHGIHHIDSAQIYGTEAQVVGAIKAAGLQREDVYVTTKCELSHTRLCQAQLMSQYSTCLVGLCASQHVSLGR